MKEVFDLIRQRLEKEWALADEDKERYIKGNLNVFKYANALGYKNAIEAAIEIVNQVTEEYKDKDCSKCSRRSWYQIGYADAEKKYGNGWIPCSRFNNMIEAFECDFGLAKDGAYSISELDDKIKFKDKKLMEDIDLLEELSYLLRNGEATICLKGE